MVRLDKRFLVLFLSVAILFAAASFRYYRKTVQDDGHSISQVDFRVYYYAGFRLEGAEEIYNIKDGFFIYKYSPLFALAMCTMRFRTLTPAHALCVWYFILFIFFILGLYAIKEILFRPAGGVTLSILWIIPVLFIFRYLVLINFIHYLPHYWPRFVEPLEKFLYWTGAVYILSLFFIRKDTKGVDYLPAITLGILLNLRFILENIDRAQVNIIILGLLLFFCYYLINKKDITAGIYLGIGMIIKIVPAIFLLYLLIKKRFKAFISAMATFAILLFIPYFKWGMERNVELIKDWSRMLRITLPMEYIDYKNQSLMAMVSRFFSKNSDVALIGLGQRDLTIIIAIAYMAALFILIYMLMRKGKAALSKEEEMARDLSLFFIAMTALSPIGTKTTFVYTLLPCIILTKEAFERRLKDKYLNFGLLAYTALIYLNSPDVIGDLSIILHKYSLMTVCLFILFSLTAYAKFRKIDLTEI